MQERECFLPAAQVRQRYSVTDMSLWRWLKDDSLGFPQPIRIKGRRFWRLDDLRAWEASQASDTANGVCRNGVAHGGAPNNRLRHRPRHRGCGQGQHSAT
jgi:predicted DNA-binding transcriptional regulator AlpA